MYCTVREEKDYNFALTLGELLNVFPLPATPNSKPRFLKTADFKIVLYINHKMVTSVALINLTKTSFQKRKRKL